MATFIRKRVLFVVALALLTFALRPAQAAHTAKHFVLVHGGFSDHATNWEFIAPTLQERFTVYMIARRGRGETDATDGHSVADESNDVAALIRMIGQPVFLLGHSYGGQCALAAALAVPDSDPQAGGVRAAMARYAQA